MPEVKTKEPVKRSFTLPASLYERMGRIAEQESRTINAQTVRWLERVVREHEEKSRAA